VRAGSGREEGLERGSETESRRNGGWWGREKGDARGRGSERREWGGSSLFLNAPQ
jgi:hypothetical protein